jgi:hypothetical protein
VFKKRLSALLPVRPRQDLATRFKNSTEDDRNGER